MHRLIPAALSILLAACTATPDLDMVPGGARVDLTSVTYELPGDQPWGVIMRQADQAAFGALGRPRNETLIVSSATYNIQTPATRADFLQAVQAARSNTPDTGRFQVIRNTEQLVTDRTETCVQYRSASRDFGADGRPGGQYTVLETIGMHCVHPGKPGIGVQVELSRRAPPDLPNPDLDAQGQALLRSVTFPES